MNHESSRMMEEPLLHSAKRKREILQSSMEADATRGENKGTRFYEDGVWELLKARSQQPKFLLLARVLFKFSPAVSLQIQSISLTCVV